MSERGLTVPNGVVWSNSPADPSKRQTLGRTTMGVGLSRIQLNVVIQPITGLRPSDNDSEIAVGAVN